MGVASVYRALALLSELGVLQRVPVAGGSARYELAGPGGDHHHHLVCDDCGATAAFEDEALERAIGRLSRRTAYCRAGARRDAARHVPGLPVRLRAAERPPGKIRAMGTAAWRARAGVLVLLGALVVHELRYVLAGRHPDAQAHAYMDRLVPFACALLVLAGDRVPGARLALRRRVDARALSAGGVRWLALSCMLIGIFAVQESAEMLFEHGRLDLADSLIVHGSWLGRAALVRGRGPSSRCCFEGAKALLAQTGSPERPAPRRRRSRPRRALPRREPARVPVFACNLAGRAPPSFVN